MTQGGFGERIGLTDAMVSMIESGKNTLQDRTVRLICYTFGVNEDWLRHGKGDMLSPKAKTDDEKQLLEMFGRLTNEMKQIVLQIVKHLLNADETRARPTPEQTP